MQQKGKGKGGDGKGGKQNWRLPCNDYWKPEGCQHGHHCPRYHPRRQPGRCAICGSTRHYTKPKAKNAEYDENAWHEDVEWQESTWETEEYEASKGKKGKGKMSKPKGRQRARALRDLSHPDLLKARLLEVIDLILKPNQKQDHAWRMTFYLQCLQSPSLRGDILHGMVKTT